MPFIPLQPPAAMDTDGLRKHGEDQFREVARAWTGLDATLTTTIKYTSQSLTAAQKDQARQNIAASPVLRGYLAGLTMFTPAGAELTVGAGMATDSTGVDTMVLSAAINKASQVAWGVGSGNGCLDTGAFAVNTWYHVHLIKRPDTGVVDFLTSLSPTAPTLPASYTLSRRIGAVRSASAGISLLAFTQFGDEFLWNAPITNYSALSVTVISQLATLSTPTGVKTFAKFWADYSNNTALTLILFSSPDQPVFVAAGGVGTGINVAPATATRAFTEFMIRTNTSSQVRVVCFTGTTLTTAIVTFGWEDRRGRED